MGASADWDNLNRTTRWASDNLNSEEEVVEKITCYSWGLLSFITFLLA